MDKNTFADSTTNVKGGIPILFPQCGKIPDDTPGAFGRLKQHGFARNSILWQSEASGQGFMECLMPDEYSMSVYPYSFRLCIHGRIENDGSCTIFQTAYNIESDQSMPVAFGLHPYFNVQHEDKEKIEFRFEGGRRTKIKSE